MHKEGAEEEKFLRDRMSQYLVSENIESRKTEMQSYANLQFMTFTLRCD